METNKIFMSSVAHDGAKKGILTVYQEPVKLGFTIDFSPHSDESFIAAFMSCYISISREENPELVREEDLLVKKHFVSDNTKLYKINAYLGMDENNDLKDRVPLFSNLPAGLEMLLMDVAEEKNVFVSSGEFSVLLFSKGNPPKINLTK